MGVEYPAETKHPVVDPDPGVVKAIQKFRTQDWTTVAGATATTTVLGYYMGRSTYMHRPTAVMGGIIGFTFAVALGLQNSMGRLMGRVENALEVQASKAE